MRHEKKCERGPIKSMQGFHQVLFILSLVALSWLTMMVVHELGHVIGGMLTGGTVQYVALPPFGISRTHVSPNPHPAIVVWLGPLSGCALPVAVFAWIGRRFLERKNIARFLAGFCLIANGAYIACGAVDRIGDCGVMLDTGTPIWVMITFGVITVPLGLYLWHGLGSLQRVLDDPPMIKPWLAYVVFFTWVMSISLEFALSAR